MESDVLNNKKVLIVDDYPINRMLFSSIVNELGGECITASNGIECLEIVKKDNIDLILMDINMPKMDRIVATTAIRALPGGKNIKIIGITGYEDSGEIDECFQAGMDEAVTKIMFTSEKLVEVSLRIFSGSVSTPVSENKPVSDASADINVPFDYSRALKGFDNNKEILDSVLVEFNHILSQQIISMHESLDTMNLESLRRDAHSIKGGAANLCAQPLSDVARDIEIACKNENKSKEKLTELLTCLETRIDEFVRYNKSLNSHMFTN